MSQWGTFHIQTSTQPQLQRTEQSAVGFWECCCLCRPVSSHERGSERCVCYHIWLYMGTEDSNKGTHACAANTLSIELSSHSPLRWLSLCLTGKPKAFPFFHHLFPVHVLIHHSVLSCSPRIQSSIC